MIATIQKVIDYIEERLLTDLDYDELYKLTRYSKYYITRQFRNIMGMTISEYYIKRRLSLSALCLRNTKKKICDIALEFGFCSSPHYTKAFKNEFHITPSNYKKGNYYINYVNKQKLKEGKIMKYTDADMNQFIEELLYSNSIEEVKMYLAKAENCLLVDQKDSDLTLLITGYNEKGLGKAISTLHINMITGTFSIIKIYTISDNEEMNNVEITNLRFEDNHYEFEFRDNNTYKKSQVILYAFPERRINFKYSVIREEKSK